RWSSSSQIRSTSLLVLNRWYHSPLKLSPAMRCVHCLPSRRKPRQPLLLSSLFLGQLSKSARLAASGANWQTGSSYPSCHHTSNHNPDIPWFLPEVPLAP